MTIPFHFSIQRFFEGRKGYLLLSNIEGENPVRFYFSHPDPQKRSPKLPKRPRPNKRTAKNSSLKIQCIGVLSEFIGDRQPLPKKSILLGQVEQTLGTKISHKVFNEACGAAFPRKRGRPPKIK